MEMKPYATVALLVLTVYSCAVYADTDLAQSAYLDGAENFHMQWQYTDDNITIIAKVKTTGWFGIGFSPNGGMAGADIITAGFANGKPYIQDRYATRNGYPALDDSQDVELLSGSEENGITTIKFTRKHNTCDDKDRPIGMDTMRVIYAISSDGSDQISYHSSNRGSRSLYLRKQITTKNDVPDDAITFDITVDNVPIPARETKYFCELKRAPKLDSKHHLIKAEPLIQKGNQGFVHHILLYGCFDGKNREFHFKNKQTGHECYGNPNMPRDLNACRSPVVAWAVGGGSVDFPKEAGFAMGDGKSPDYYLMEIHYDNPQLISGKKDSSGLRLTLTKSLRQYDAGLMGTGAVDGISIPPNVKDFKFRAFCSGTCTRKLMKNKVTVFGAVLHGHLAARGISAIQFRNGKEHRVIDEDNAYDFNYQQYKMLEKPIDFLPGDDVMVTCSYETMGRKSMTFGGKPSSSEMCIAYLFYYPVQDISDCFTAPGFAGPVRNVKKIINNNLKYPTTISQQHYQAFLSMTAANAWTDERVKALENVHLDVPQVEGCVNKSRQPVFGWLKQNFSPPAAAKSLKKRVDDQCAAPTKAQSKLVLG